jgi:hypothetical protein
MCIALEPDLLPPQVATKIPSIFDLPLSEEDARRFPGHPLVSPAARIPPTGRTWTREEDDKLMQAISGQTNICWSDVAATIGRHTAKQCRERWLVKLNPNVRRSPFEPWEDEIIQFECERIGNRWSVIAQRLPGRTSCSVKNPWYTVLRLRPMCLSKNRKSLPMDERDDGFCVNSLF